MAKTERQHRWEERERKMDILAKMAFVLGVAVLAMTALQIAGELSNQAAMESCMSKGFSYGTCFTELNR
jgi:hypothetical protein